MSKTKMEKEMDIGLHFRTNRGDFMQRCPFCKNRDEHMMYPITFEMKLMGRDRIGLRCKRCGAVGPQGETVEIAKKFWQARTLQDQQKISYFDWDQKIADGNSTVIKKGDEDEEN